MRDVQATDTNVWLARTTSILSVQTTGEGANKRISRIALWDTVVTGYAGADGIGMLHLDRVTPWNYLDIIDAKILILGIWIADSRHSYCHEVIMMRDVYRNVHRRFLAVR
jgi:hypothetical protein